MYSGDYDKKNKTTKKIKEMIYIGKAQRDKGMRAEREYARLIGGERAPLSGAAGGSFTGDVKGLGITWEVKVRRDGFKQLYGWLEKSDALAVRADRKQWLVVMPIDRFMSMQNSALPDQDKEGVLT